MDKTQLVTNLCTTPLTNHQIPATVTGEVTESGRCARGNASQVITSVVATQNSHALFFSGGTHLQAYTHAIMQTVQHIHSLKSDPTVSPIDIPQLDQSWLPPAALASLDAHGSRTGRRFSGRLRTTSAL